MMNELGPCVHDDCKANGDKFIRFNMRHLNGKVPVFIWACEPHFHEVLTQTRMVFDNNAECVGIYDKINDTIAFFPSFNKDEIPSKFCKLTLGGKSKIVDIEKN